MIYAQKYGVSRASRKYNKSRSFIYFWMARYDGTLESLACRSRRPHSHPNQHTPAELKLIRDMRRRNPELGMIELWSRLKKRGYKRCPESLFRVMRRMGIFPEAKPKKRYQPKPYEQMTHPGERIQIDVKVVQSAVLPTLSFGFFSTQPSMNFLGYVFWQHTLNRVPTLLPTFLNELSNGLPGAVFMWNAFKLTTVLNLPTVFPLPRNIC
jgi:transposase